MANNSIMKITDAKLRTNGMNFMIDYVEEIP